jgi:hypothetical protein
MGAFDILLTLAVIMIVLGAVGAILSALVSALEWLLATCIDD